MTRLAPLLLLGACATARTGVLRLGGGPADALVTIDDRYVGKLGRLQRFGVKLPAGEHRVTVEATGYFPKDEVVRVPADGAAQLRVKLEEIPD